MWTNTRKRTMSATKQINSLAEVKCLAVATAGEKRSGERELLPCFVCCCCCCCFNRVNGQFSISAVCSFVSSKLRDNLSLISQIKSPQTFGQIRTNLNSVCTIQKNQGSVSLVATQLKFQSTVEQDFAMPGRRAIRHINV